MIGQTLIVVGAVAGEDVLTDVLKGAGKSVTELVSGINFISTNDYKDKHEDVYDVVGRDPKELDGVLGDLCIGVDNGDSFLVVGYTREDSSCMLKTILRRRATVNKGLLVIVEATEKRLRQAKELLDRKGIELGKDVSVFVTVSAFTGAQGLRNLHRDCKYVGWTELMDVLDVVVYEDAEEDEHTEIYKVVHENGAYTVDDWKQGDEEDVRD